MIVLNSKLPQWPIKQYIPAAPHVWLIWSSGTLHAELYGLPLPTFSLLLVVTSHLVLNVFARYLLLSGIVSRLTSILVKLSQHSADTLNLIFSIQPLSLPSEWPISAPLIRSRLWSIINLFTYLLTCLCLCNDVCYCEWENSYSFHHPILRTGGLWLLDHTTWQHPAIWRRVRIAVSDSICF